MSYDLPFVGRLHSLLVWGWMSRFNNDLSHSSSHVPHHRPSLWYIGLLIAVLMGLFCGGGCSYCGVDVQGRSTEK